MTEIKFFYLSLKNKLITKLEIINYLSSFLNINPNLEIGNFSSAMIIAHNPGMTNLINEITNICLDNLPTTGLAEIDFSCLKWNEISSKNSNLIQLKFPNQLK